MPRPDFATLRVQLLRAGITPRNTARTVAELRDHYDDLEAEERSFGLSAQDAGTLALKRLGDPADIVEQAGRRHELRSWIYRYPCLARVVLPVAYVAMAPIAHAPDGIELVTVIIRWGACLVLSAAVTSLMLLIMQMSISLT